MRTTFKTIAFAAILLSLCLSVFSQQVAKTIPNSTSPDGLIGFLEFRPRDYGSQKHPLIIFLHGIGERGNGTSQINSVTANAIPKYCAAGATMRFTVAGQTSSFVVLSPQLSTQYGYWPTYYVTEMIKYAKANLSIDPNRIYITGLSLGGGGTWRAITEAGTENFDYSFDAGIAAAAPVCGTQEENDGYFCRTIGANHLPVWAFHCMDDGTVGVGATQHAEILAKGCGVTPAAKFTYYQSGGHGGAWTNAYDTGHITTTVNGGGSFTANPNMYEWFLSNTRGTTQPANTAPVANAGNAQTITLPASSVTLSGTGTGTGGATISSYAWVKTSGPSAGISAAGSASTGVTGLSQGTYVFTLTVTDNHGLTNSSSVTITVNTAANTAPVASAGNGQTITLPSNSVTLSGSGTGTNGASISAYAWVKTSGPSAGISAAGAASTGVTGLTQGTYVFTLTVTDNHGLTNSSAVTIVVNAAPASAPAAAGKLLGYIKISDGPMNGCTDNSTSGRIAVYGNNVANGSVLYTDAAMTQVYNGGWNWFSFTPTLGGASTAAFAVYPIGSIFLFTSCGVPSGNTAPVANAGNAQTITLPASAVTLSGSGSGTNGASISSYAWVKTSGPSSGNISSSNAASTTVTGLSQGTYVFTLTVTDNHGLTSSATVTTTVNGANKLLGYIRMDNSPYQACSDVSTSNRIAVYGNSIANGSTLYTDAAMTQAYNGGWNWFSFTPALGGSNAYTFAIYPVGSIFYLRDCSNGGARIAAPATSPEEDMAALKRTKDSATIASTTIGITNDKLSIYPNPVQTNATIALNSVDDGVKTINLYNNIGVLKAKYTWQTVKGHNVFSLKNVSGMANGIYIIEVRDNNGKSIGSLKFFKM